MSLDTLVDLMGKPWRVGATGPDAYDCWSLVVEVQRRLFERKLPAHQAKSYDIRELVKYIEECPERRQWRKTTKAHHGALVEMSHRKHPHHVGVWLVTPSGEGVLHCQCVGGVQWTPQNILSAEGWNAKGLTYYEYVGDYQ